MATLGPHGALAATMWTDRLMDKGEKQQKQQQFVCFETSKTNN
jgi:hypothetical protein